MKILTFTTLYPNSIKPTFALFVENRLRHLKESHPISSVVVAPVPWVPFFWRFISKYKQSIQIPQEEERAGIKVFHPRFLHFPIVGAWLSPLLIAISAYSTLKKLKQDGYLFELIDAHYFYPDGVAAVILSKLFKVPVVITARGSDINLFPQLRLPRWWILWAAKRSNHIITVSKALSQSLINLGVPRKKITVLRNGVELDLFKPLIDREKIRQEKQLSDIVLISVGRLEELKGHDLIIKALKEIKNATLLIAGEGPLKKTLVDLASDLGILNRVKFLGPVLHSDLPMYYAISDVLVLASSREGWPNVLLEAMACGTPAVATNVGGTPEIITTLDAGILASSRTVEGLVDAIRKLLLESSDRENTRKYAEGFSWEDTSAGQYSLFKLLVNKT